jgi:hypothetical protein
MLGDFKVDLYSKLFWVRKRRRYRVDAVRSTRVSSRIDNVDQGLVAEHHGNILLNLCGIYLYLWDCRKKV